MLSPLEFEQLVCRWLDEPDPRLAEEIEAALAASPELRSVHAECLRVDRLLRDACDSALPVDWIRLSQRLSSGVLAADGQADVRLDALLAGISATPAGVDWGRFAGGVRDELAAAARAQRAAPPPAAPRRSHLLGRIYAAGSVAAAACIALVAWVWLSGPAVAPAVPGSVRVALAPRVVADSGGYARVVVHAPPGASLVDAPRAAPAGELFLMIAPPHAAAIR